MAEGGQGDWVAVQEKTFKTWANQYLKEAGEGQVDNVETDFQDGVLLYHLLCALDKDNVSPHPKIQSNPKIKAQKLDNLNICMNMLKALGIQLTNIGAADVYDGNRKLILALLWQIILRFDVCKFTEDGDAKKGRQDLLLWVQNRCEEKGVEVNNFTTDFEDGTALAALVSSVRGADLKVEEGGVSRGKRALDICVEDLGLPEFLDEGEIGKDEKSMMTFLAQFYQRYGTREEVAVNRKVEELQVTVDPKQSLLEGNYRNAIRFEMNQFRIVPKDKDGNDVACKYRQVTASLSGLQNGKTVPVQLHRNEDGSFSASFVPVDLGPHMLDVTINGEHLNPCPVVLNVVDGGVDASQCHAYGPGLDAGNVAGRHTHFTVETRGSKGALVDAKDGDVSVVIRNRDTGETVDGATVSRTSLGVFRCDYKVGIPGVYDVEIYVGGQAIKGTPRTVNITGGSVDASTCRVYGPGVEDRVSVGKTNFTVKTNDSEGNPIAASPEAVGVFVCGPNGVVPVSVVPQEDGTLAVDYSAEEEGNYFVDVKVNGTSIAGCPKKVVAAARTPPVAPPRPMTDAVLPPPIPPPKGKQEEAEDDGGLSMLPCVPGNSIARGPGVQAEVERSDETHFFVEPRDANGRMCVLDVGSINAVVQYPDGTDRSCQVTRQEDGMFRCAYSPTEEGPYVVDVEIDQYGVKGNPFSVLVVPGAAPRKMSTVPASSGSSRAVGDGMIKKGFLNKQGGVRKNWKRRYFEVNDKTVKYFSDVGGSELGSIPIDEIKGVYEINNLKNHTYAFGLLQKTNDRVYVLEANSDDNRHEWMSCFKRLMEQNFMNQETTADEDAEDAEAYSSQMGEDYDVSAYDEELNNFFQQLYFEIRYPKSTLVVNELFRIRIVVMKIETKTVVNDHKGKLEVVINMPDGATTTIEPMKAPTAGHWVAMFTPSLDGRHSLNVRFLGKYIQSKPANLTVRKKRTLFG
mmetsp:Transcript_28060/g.78480  ORF Transcript_28060/g.78480 Transcript_28060/m.78480 type:complete len:965 (+) Transcript_28060:126-3020(+)|eukprot:CAMPEP_0119133724 /NCGR_PEP_ID=MMETSP1310-20130426/13522_1 /TAXON_ID=464262 /ORGANISM="Genus nov. species nov., Strain RCC2339" /LENGTH=964 /DNA_ID=CAMNT_0007124425 /DNA_START=86 /DNA_END=2980 /DNA_ORIENTATION=-